MQLQIFKQYLGGNPGLVQTGLVHLGGVFFSQSGIILAGLGIMTGILFFIADTSEKLGTKIGGHLLGAWLVAGCLMHLFNIHFSGSGVILVVLGVAAGVMVLINRR